MSLPEAERKLDRPDHANDPAEESIHELFVLLVTWGFFWVPVIAFGWVVYSAITMGFPHPSPVPRLWPEVIGVAAAYLVALIVLLRCDRRSRVIGQTLWPALQSAARRFAFPTTLVAGGLIGAYMAHHSADARPARYVAVACVQTLACPDYAARLAAGEVDIHGYLTTTTTAR